MFGIGRRTTGVVLASVANGFGIALLGVGGNRVIDGLGYILMGAALLGFGCFVMRELRQVEEDDANA